MHREKASIIADELYFIFIDSLHDDIASEYVEMIQTVMGELGTPKKVLNFIIILKI
jgi:hypothetical protein